jgi:hypothetical protein
MPEIEIRFASDREYERLRHIRNKYGVQWRGMLILGARRLEDRRHAMALSRSSQERNVSPGCTERPIENDTTNADADVDRWRSSVSR